MQFFSKSDLVAGCVGGVVAWFGMNYAMNRWKKIHSNSSEQVCEKQTDEIETNVVVNNSKRQNEIHSYDHIHLLHKRVRSLQINVLDLEDRNERLREANRTLTKLANSTANIGFQEKQRLYKKLNNSPKSREEGEMIFIDYPSYEFAVVRPSSNEV